MQTVKAFIEAEKWNGPSIIIAYSHCIAHGYDLQFTVSNSRNWPSSPVTGRMFRYNPALVAEGKNPFVLDSQGAQPASRQIHLQRNALHHAGTQPSRKTHAACWPKHRPTS